MKNNKILLLPFTESKLSLFILFVVLTLLSTISVIVLNLDFYDKYEDINLNNNILVSSQDLNADAQKEQVFTIFGNIDDYEIEKYSVNDKLNLINVEFRTEISQILKKSLIDIYNDAENITPVAYPNLTSEIIMENNIPNETYNIKYIISGGYPINKNDILISELNAAALLGKYNLNEYNDLIGMEIELNINDKIYKFKISGVKAGGKDYILNKNHEIFKTENEVNQFDYYYKFTNESSKEKFIIDHNLSVDTYIDNSINTINTKFIIIISYIISSMVFSFIICFKNVTKNLMKLNYYKFNLGSILFFIPFILCYFIIVTLTFFILI